MYKEISGFTAILGVVGSGGVETNIGFFAKKGHFLLTNVVLSVMFSAILAFDSNFNPLNGGQY